VALLSAVLVAALAGILAAALAREQMLVLHRTGNVMQAEQAYLYGLGLETWARKILAEDPRDQDGATDLWAQPLPPVDVDGGVLNGLIVDLNGRFNVNNLLDDAGPDEIQVARFRRLLAHLGLNPSLADAVVDWLDEDAMQRPGGAEDQVYLSRRPQYRTANRDLASVSELRAIAGIDANAYAILEPHVTALPVRTAINVNTATAPVLASLHESISYATAELLVQGSRRKPYSSIDEFLQDAQLPPDGRISEGLDVNSDFFLTLGVVTLGDIELRLFSVLYRADTGAIQMVARSQTVY
jgi:general secretion pathway protein K